MTSFPEGFIWGTAASSTQCEGAAPASDWIEWEKAAKVPVSGDGNGFATRYRDDFRILAGLGLDHHRLSIEWARIEPAEGKRDAATVEHYLDVLGAAREEGIKPWVCLHHFTLPQWFTDKGGFLDEGAREHDWRRHVEFIAETYGDLVEGWQPINEPAAYTAMSYLGGMGPPGLTDLNAFQDATRAIYLAWRDAWRGLNGAKPVATIHNLSPIYTADDSPGAALAAKVFDANIFDVPIRALRDGVLAIPGRKTEEIDGLAGSADYVGFSYYSAFAVGGGGAIGIDMRRPYPPDAKVSAMGYAPWPEGIGVVLDRLHDELPGIPILIVENGIGTEDDDWRRRFLTTSLATVADRIASGVNVRGYFHWTAADNYEWHAGYSVQFGLMTADREVKPSAQVLVDAARTSKGE